MMGLREFVELFDKNEVKNLFNALSSCIEYVRIDLHVFNIGAYVTCLYSNDLESLSQTEGCNVNMMKEKPIAMIQPTVKDGWCAFRQPDGLCELHDRGLKPTEGVLASCKVVKEDNVPTYETSVLRAVAHEWVKVENFATIMRVVFKFLHENERRK
jgi:hypothetical protein